MKSMASDTKDHSKGRVILYRNHMEVRLEKETVWLTQKQMADLFDTERSVITKHVNNILKTRELEARSVCAKFAHTAEDGKTYRPMFYNLDVIISVIRHLVVMMYIPLWKKRQHICYILLQKITVLWMEISALLLLCSFAFYKEMAFCGTKMVVSGSMIMHL